MDVSNRAKLMSLLKHKALWFLTSSFVLWKLFQLQLQVGKKSSAQSLQQRQGLAGLWENECCLKKDQDQQITYLIRSSQTLNLLTFLWIFEGSVNRAFYNRFFFFCIVATCHSQSLHQQISDNFILETSIIPWVRNGELSRLQHISSRAGKIMDMSSTLVQCSRQCYESERILL